MDRTAVDLAAAPIVLEEEVRWEPGFDVELVEDLTADFTGLGVVATEREALTEPALGMRLTKWLEPERTGSATVAARTVFFHREGDTEEESHLDLEPITIEIAGVPADLDLAPPAPRPVFTEDPDPASKEPFPWLFAAGGLLVVIAGAGLVALLFRGLGKRPAPRKPAHETALEALQQLEAKDLLKRGEAERFFVILSHIMRVYLDGAFSVPATERTTEELLRALGTHELLAERRGDLDGFFALADRVKFAHGSAESSAMQEAFSQVRAFVESTRQYGEEPS
ncbi:MAG: hypothetical protein ACYS22_10675 [Planctomycetota bacterium]